MKLNDEDRLMNIKVYTLAEAITSVNGQPLIELYNEKDNKSDMEKCIEIISDLQSNLVDAIFKRYEELVVKSNSFFTGDLNTEIKN